MEFFQKKPVDFIKVNKDSSPEDIEAELEYWEQQYQIAGEIGDKEGRRDILVAIQLLNEWI